MPMCRSPPFLSKNAEKKKWFDIIVKMQKRSSTIWSLFQ